MLVLARKANESITVGDIKITVTRIGETRVRIGIDAPKDLPVIRTELLGSPFPSDEEAQG